MAVETTDSESVGFHQSLVKRFKVILIGAHAPRIDPFRILKGLLRARVSTPVFFLSDSATRDSRYLGQYANLMGIITKPLDLREFSRYLETADRPPELEPGEKEQILAVLAKWEKAP